MARSLRCAALLCIGIPLLLAAITALAFGPLFTFFHHVFFPQGNWQFPWNAYLILIFPEPFWIMAALLILILIALTGIGCWFAADMLAHSSSVRDISQ
jgi:uncharacterized membrane protein